MNQNGEIKCNYPQLLYEGELYLDWTCLVNLSGQASTNLYRLIKTLDNVPKINYKNRSYYLTSWCLNFWRHVGDKNR